MNSFFVVPLIDQGENVFFKLLNDLTQHSIISQEISTQELGNISALFVDKRYLFGFLLDSIYFNFNSIY